ncbi:MAG: hypothetical protein QNK35_00155 [Bacteroides sp.]|nr:hypothetical protein [Bacteroides sp.]
MKKALSTRTVLSLPGMFFALLIVLWSCNTSKQKQTDSSESSDVKSTKEAVIEDLSGYPIPTSFEITQLIYEAGAPYILPLSNDPEKASSYITKKDQALNLGVYGADLCYASTYMMKQGTMLFLEASKTLLDEMGVSTAFNADYATRVENSLDDRDSLIMIVSESFYDTWKYLVGNKQDVLARLVVCGSWIEGIYIAANIAQTSKEPAAFLQILAKQKGSLNKIIATLEPIKDAEEVKDVIKGLYALQGIYEGVGDTLTEEQLENLFEQIESLRSAIV